MVSTVTRMTPFESVGDIPLAHWLVLIGLVVAIAWPLIESLHKRARRKETDLEVLNRLAPRPPAPYVRASPVQASLSQQVPQASSQASMSRTVRVLLTLLYVPGSVALYAFWNLVRPGIAREVAQIDIGYPRLVAALWAAFAVLVYSAPTFS